MKTFKKLSSYLLFAILFSIFTFSNQICMAQTGSEEEPGSPASYTTAGGFVFNKGQLFGTDTLQHREVYYYGNAGNTTLYLSDSVFSYVYAEADTDTIISDSFHTYYKVDTVYRTDMKLKGITNNFEIIATDTSQGYHNYFYGDSAWKHALTYQQIKYAGIYTGIDLLFHNSDEFRFNLNSSADPTSIKFYYQGTDSVRIKQQDTVINIYTPLGNKSYFVAAYQFVSNAWSKFDAEF